MRFSEGASLDPSDVSDHRGLGGGALAFGGGGVVSIIALVVYLLGGGLSGGLSGASDPYSLGAGQTGGGAGGRSLSAECRTGADANQREDCRIVAIVNSVQDEWRASIRRYREAKTILFSARVSTACGSASSAVGPFYCPADETIYIDLDFFGELERRFGARGGPFAQAYVVAHEYGHHVQHLLGTDRQVGSDREGATSGSVRLELQADCYAGVWAGNALKNGLIEELTDDDIAIGLDAAAAIGDDRIQQQATGEVDPDSWTHGSSAQRQRWFTQGYRTGDRYECDTFAATTL